MKTLKRLSSFRGTCGMPRKYYQTSHNIRKRNKYTRCWFLERTVSNLCRLSDGKIFNVEIRKCISRERGNLLENILKTTQSDEAI